jgi:hypothetical protein
MEEKGTRHNTVTAGHVSQICKGGTPSHPKRELVLAASGGGRDVQRGSPPIIAFDCDLVIGTLL